MYCSVPLQSGTSDPIRLRPQRLHGDNPLGTVVAVVLGPPSVPPGRPGPAEPARRGSDPGQDVQDAQEVQDGPDAARMVLRGQCACGLWGAGSGSGVGESRDAVLHALSSILSVWLCRYLQQTANPFLNFGEQGALSWAEQVAK